MPDIIFATLTIVGTVLTTTFALGWKISRWTTKVEQQMGALAEKMEEGNQQQRTICDLRTGEQERRLVRLETVQNSHQ